MKKIGGRKSRLTVPLRRIISICCVACPQRFDDYPDPTVNFDNDPDPTTYGVYMLRQIVNKYKKIKFIF